MSNLLSICQVLTGGFIATIPNTTMIRTFSILLGSLGYLLRTPRSTPMFYYANYIIIDVFF